MTLVQVGALLQLDSSMELCGFKLAMVSKSWTCKWRTFYHSLAPTFCVKSNSGQFINEHMGHQWHTTCQHHLVSKWESYCGLCRDEFVRRPGMLQNRRFIYLKCRRVRWKRRSAGHEAHKGPTKICWFHTCWIVEGSLEVKLPTIWRDEKQSREEAERRERLEERRVEEKE